MRKLKGTAGEGKPILGCKAEKDCIHVWDPLANNGILSWILTVV